MTGTSLDDEQARHGKLAGDELHYGSVTRERAPDLDTVLAEIREAVTENTASGLYSESLEDELRSHFARLLARRDADQFGAVWNAVDDLEALRSLPRGGRNTASRVPGGELVHKATGRLVDRQLAELADRSDLMWQATIVALRSIASVLDEPVTHTHADLLHELDTLQDRVASLERDLGRARAALAELEPDDGDTANTTP